MEIFIHRSGKERIELREVDGSATVAEAIGLADGEAVWLEEGDESGLDTGRTMNEAVGERGHVHVNRCHRIAVTVNFNGAKEHPFGPGATINRVFTWATGKDGFSMSPEDRAEHVLQVCGTKDQPSTSDHIGSFVSEGSCQVCLDLVPKHRFEG